MGQISVEIYEPAGSVLSGNQQMILNQQIADIGQGRPLSTRIQLSSLSAEEKAELRSVLAVLRTVPDMVHDLILS